MAINTKHKNKGLNIKLNNRGLVWKSKMASCAQWCFIFMALVWCGRVATGTKELNDVPCVACSQAMSTMAPCFEFLQGGPSSEPSPKCCLAGMQLSAWCSTPETRKAVCY